MAAVRIAAGRCTVATRLLSSPEQTWTVSPISPETSQGSRTSKPDRVGAVSPQWSRRNACMVRLVVSLSSDRLSHAHLPGRDTQVLCIKVSQSTTLVSTQPTGKKSRLNSLPAGFLCCVESSGDQAQPPHACSPSPPSSQVAPALWPWELISQLTSLSSSPQRLSRAARSVQHGITRYNGPHTSRAAARVSTAQNPANDWTCRTAAGADCAHVSSTRGSRAATQFDTSAVAVIMTVKSQRARYESLASGDAPVESS
jgi:hypothetical protein